MNIDRNKLLPVGLVAAAVVIIGLIIWFSSGGRSLIPESWTGVAGDPINVTLDFYEAWLSERQEHPENPNAVFASEVLEMEQVGPELRERLRGFEGQLTAESEDPVLCQTGLPEGLRTLPVYQQEEAAQILVMSTTQGQSGQAVINMEARDGLWRIVEITCGNAEAGPQGEYSFDRSGFLLKQVPEPLNSEYWHLVFQEAGVLGHAVPLFLDENSVCVDKEGNESTCSDEVLQETAPARVMGEMSESGVQVERIEMVESVSIED